MCLCVNVLSRSRKPARLSQTLPTTLLYLCLCMPWKGSISIEVDVDSLVDGRDSRGAEPAGQSGRK
jgi:hypothetical protein